MSKVLLAGESWVTHSDPTSRVSTSFFTSKRIRRGHREAPYEALETAGNEVTFLPNHVAPSGRFPGSAEELSRYDAIILSDIGRQFPVSPSPHICLVGIPAEPDHAALPVRTKRRRPRDDRRIPFLFGNRGKSGVSTDRARGRSACPHDRG